MCGSDLGIVSSQGVTPIGRFELEYEVELCPKCVPYWIDVEDVLPVDGESVLVCIRNENYVTVGWYDQRRKVWIEQNELIYPTHWLPFPKAQGRIWRTNDE